MLPQIYDEIIKMVSNLLVIGLVDDGRRAAIYVDDIKNTQAGQRLRRSLDG